MHEFSMMVDIVEAALKAIENYDVENVEKVFLDVGELTFLNPEQLKSWVHKRHEQIEKDQLVFIAKQMDVLAGIPK